VIAGDDSRAACEQGVDVFRRGDGTRCGVPSTVGGLGGRRTSGSCSYVFQHGMFCVEFRVLVHHASISGGVCGVCGVCGVRGVRGVARAEAQSVP